MNIKVSQYPFGVEIEDYPPIYVDTIDPWSWHPAFDCKNASILIIPRIEPTSNGRLP